MLTSSITRNKRVRRKPICPMHFRDGNGFTLRVSILAATVAIASYDLPVRNGAQILLQVSLVVEISRAHDSVG